MSNEYRVSYGMTAVRPVGAMSFRTVAPPPETLASKAARFAINVAIALMIAVTVVCGCLFLAVFIPPLAGLGGFALGAVGVMAFTELKR